jgi:hypothetical protein
MASTEYKSEADCLVGAATPEASTRGSSVELSAVLAALWDLLGRCQLPACR